MDVNDLARYYRNIKCFDSVARAANDRSSLKGEIPIARRATPQRWPWGKRATVFAIGAFALCGTVIGGLIQNKLFVSSSSNSSLDGREEESTRLRGHFPYPEAVRGTLVEVYPGIELHVDTAKALSLMSAAASASGVNLILLSGYRSHELQDEIFYGVKSQRNQTASQRAKVSAPPGYSEHSTGYAIDLGDGSFPDTHFEVAFESTKAFRWLKENAAKYHFILSFPRNNAQGVSYEPWHWRYEGTTTSLQQFESANRLSLD